MLRKLVVAVLALQRDRLFDEEDGCVPAGAAERPLEILVGLDVEADVEGSSSSNGCDVGAESNRWSWPGMKLPRTVNGTGPVYGKAYA